MSHKIYLASASPRRRELVTQLGYVFDQFAVDADESIFENESPTNYVERLARLKAQTAIALGYRDRPVLGSDTAVVIHNQILGKPTNYADFERMMLALSGKTHEVLTSIAFATPGQVLSTVVTTNVTFKRLSVEEIQWYWQTNEPKDKAGGYGIQGLGGRFVTRIEGSYFAVMGLPLYETDALLHQFYAQQQNQAD
ncbi:Septum formation protein Maf [Pseudoalteromonas luteoviolacea B = ATCC 29581]|nr:Septum formation protein Maf [Pseudoalteromonas luteoviolacea B = ATCC 29581]